MAATADTLATARTLTAAQDKTGMLKTVGKEHQQQLNGKT
jgi:hypothetical protein